jgi:tetratricopeptide (TPR) repeat protein
MKLKILFVFIWSTFTFSALQAQDDAFQKANVFYQQNEYSQALAMYDSILHEGYESVELYYNMGNCYFKKDEYAQAILMWERAKLLDPGNKDIAHNLQLANSRISDQIEPLPEFFLVSTWKSLVNLFNDKSWTFINITFWFLLGLILFFFFTSQNPIRKKLSFYTALVFLFISLLSGAAGYAQHRQMNAKKQAVVMSPTVNIKASPDPSSATVFVLHSGTKVKIKEQVGKWYQISIANGNQGWIPMEDFEKI